jgi:hypothetical protein
VTFWQAGAAVPIECSFWPLKVGTGRIVINWIASLASRTNRSIAPAPRAIAVGATNRVMPSMVAVITPAGGAPMDVQVLHVLASPPVSE